MRTRSSRNSGLIAAVVLVAGCCSSAFGQSQQARPTKDELEIPLPITSPRALDPGDIVPLTPGGKAKRAVRNTIGPQAIANRALIAGYNHLLDDPEEWSGNLDGLGQRFASRMGRLAVRQGVQLTTDIAFGLDPRFDRCDCAGFWARTAHAWKRVVISRRDYGGETFAYSNFAGAFVPPMITDQWSPARQNTWSHKWQSGVQFLYLRGGTNMIREFWPEISRKLRIRGLRRSD
ncbi:MAG TPA: hypothetical protein VES20_00175 [Bryobacteraceae bacterium]|nr:hypothetical protein [Bryobacteraceae bacterium]